MHLRITGRRSSAGLAAVDAVIDALQVHLQEGSSSHVEGFFLYPEPGRSLAVLFVKGFQLLNGQRIQLFETNDSDILPVVFLLAIRQVEINFTAAEEYFPHLVGTVYKGIIDHLLKPTSRKFFH